MDRRTDTWRGANRRGANRRRHEHSFITHQGDRITGRNSNAALPHPTPALGPLPNPVLPPNPLCGLSLSFLAPLPCSHPPRPLLHRVAGNLAGLARTVVYLVTVNRALPPALPLTVSVPIMVCVFPLLVTPYAKMVPFTPLSAGPTSGSATAAATTLLSESGPNTVSNLMGHQSGGAESVGLGWVREEFAID